MKRDENDVKLFADDMTTSEDEVQFNYSRNLTEENAVLDTQELDTNSPTYKQNPTATVLQHLGRNMFNLIIKPCLSLWH